MRIGAHLSQSSLDNPVKIRSNFFFLEIIAFYYDEINAFVKNWFQVVLDI